jgi:3-oxosteroid 1-dehydrogenase
VTPDIPAWLITDQNYRNRYLFRDVAPTLPFPDSWYSSGAVFKDWTSRGWRRRSAFLGRAVGHRAPRSTASRPTGRDTDFHRGDSAYDHYYTDRPSSRTRASRRCGCRRTTPSRSCRATWARRAAC